MWKRSCGTLLGTGLAATVLAIGLAATPSLATTATTWTVKPGGSFSGSSGTVTITDTANGAEITCSSSSISGKLKSGSGLAGAKIASIAAWSFGPCNIGGTYFYTVENDPAALPYYLNAESYDAASGETTATVTGIMADMVGSGCSLDIDGTTFPNPGQVKAVYTNSTHKLVTSGGTLHFWNVSDGCLGLYKTGDHITISATYTITPAQTITSP
jgi:hypothetical protein